MCKRRFPLIWLMLFALPLYAAEQTGPEGAPHIPKSPLGTAALLETVLVLILIVGLILGLGWLVRRTGYAAGAGKGMVKVLGGVSLGPRERAVVLQTGDTRLLVGVAPGRVQILCLLPSVAADGGGSAQEKPFASRLETALEEAESDGG
jgi:flagellar protein FliO/FliZ